MKSKWFQQLNLFSCKLNNKSNWWGPASSTPPPPPTSFQLPYQLSLLALPALCMHYYVLFNTPAALGILLATIIVLEGAGCISPSMKPTIVLLFKSFIQITPYNCQLTTDTRRFFLSSKIIPTAIVLTYIQKKLNKPFIQLGYIAFNF